MAEQDWLAGQFEQNRQHLQAVAYGMLGTLGEAQDAVQEAWLRLGRSDPGASGDLRGWPVSMWSGTPSRPGRSAAWCSRNRSWTRR